MFNPLSSKTQTIVLWKIFDKEDEGLNPDRIVVGQLLSQMDIKTLQRELLHMSSLCYGRYGNDRIFTFINNL